MKFTHLKNKLKSNRGASLTIALLLFLVCTVLGSITLKAATASSGRLVDISASDARYYGVTSAADYLADVITTTKEEKDGTVVDVPRTVTLERTHVTVTTSTMSSDDGIWNTNKDSDTYSEPVYKDNSQTKGEQDTILLGAARLLMPNSSYENCFNNKIPDLGIDGYGNPIEKTNTFYMDFTVDAVDEDGEKVDASVICIKVDETLKNNGDIVLTVSNAVKVKETSENNGEKVTTISYYETGQAYKLQMYFTLKATTKDKSSSVVTNESPMTVTSGSETTTTLKHVTTSTVNRVTTLQWVLAETKKVN